MNSSIAAFSYGIVANNSFPILVDVLSSGSHGITNIWWTGVDGGDWPPVQNPSVMSAVDTNTPLAANNDAHVYAMQDGVIKEFMVAEDGVSWSEVGDVVTEVGTG
jgi:hypothetical protein